MPQAGLADLSSLATVAQTTSDDATYRYRLLDGAEIIQVDKRTPEGGWEQTYRITLGACDCPGFAYRSSCKHLDVARGLIQWWTEAMRAVSDDPAYAAKVLARNTPCAGCGTMLETLSGDRCHACTMAQARQ